MRLRDDLTMLRFDVGHAYLWHGPDGDTLIDTGLPGSAPRIERALAGRSLRAVLLTHFHQDHVGSAAEVAAWGDVTVHAHRADAPFIRGDETGPPPVLRAGWEQALFDEVRAGLPQVPPTTVRVDREVDDGDVLDLGGGVQAVCLSVPGHTPGSVAYYLPGPRVLFTGDTIARGPGGDVMLGVFNADPDWAAASFRRQAELDVAIACFGHGDPLTADTSTTLRAAAARL